MQTWRPCACRSPPSCRCQGRCSFACLPFPLVPLKRPTQNPPPHRTSPSGVQTILAPRMALGSMSRYQMDLQGQAESYDRPLSPAGSASSIVCLTGATPILIDQCFVWELLSVSCLGKPACFGRLPLSSGVPESCYQQYEKLCVCTLWWLSVRDRACCLCLLGRDKLVPELLCSA